MVITVDDSADEESVISVVDDDDNDVSMPIVVDAIPTLKGKYRVTVDSLLQPLEPAQLQEVVRASQEVNPKQYNASLATAPHFT